MDKCSAFREGAARAKQVGEEARRRQMVERAVQDGMVWRRGRNTGLGLGVLFGITGTIVMSVVLGMFVGAWPWGWQSIHEHQPEVRKQVVVTTHDSWTIGYFDEGHDFRDPNNNGEIVRGAYWWYELPERP